LTERGSSGGDEIWGEGAAGEKLRGASSSETVRERKVASLIGNKRKEAFFTPLMAINGISRVLMLHSPCSQL
jgi:hypothetical protein